MDALELILTRPPPRLYPPTLTRVPLASRRDDTGPARGRRQWGERKQPWTPDTGVSEKKGKGARGRKPASCAVAGERVPKDPTVRQARELPLGQASWDCRPAVRSRKSSRTLRADPRRPNVPILHPHRRLCQELLALPPAPVAMHHVLANATDGIDGVDLHVPDYENHGLFAVPVPPRLISNILTYIKTGKRVKDHRQAQRSAPSGCKSNTWQSWVRRRAWMTVIGL